MRGGDNMVNEDMSEYLLKCPTCSTQTKMICEESSPVIMVCQGCGRVLVMHQNRLFTVPVKFMLSLMRKHRTRVIGNIVATKISDEAERLMDDRKMQDLLNVLEDDQDVLDVIRRI